ncbi:AraC family transcriptional regulator [Brucella anthropi]|uniref:AraC family transcriptional regulator n=1 Tax=Brucella anthropi TaxID=529 RepID=UPI000CFCF4CE|nr:hypothetical protein CQ057_22760 [Ochrobactrum sp. MYb49]
MKYGFFEPQKAIETNLSVMNVAVACGYASSSHFAETFRKQYGVSPNRFSNFRQAVSTASGSGPAIW